MLASISTYFYRPVTHPQAIKIPTFEEFISKPISKISVDMVLNQYENSVGYSVYMYELPSEIAIFKSVGERNQIGAVIDNSDKKILYYTIMLNIDARNQEKSPKIRKRDIAIDNFIKYVNNLGV